MQLFLQMSYKGWILLECRTSPPDRVQALAEQRRIFERLTSSSK
jgi:hypothetical protein